LLEEAELGRPGHRVCSRADSELAVERTRVRADGVRRQVQL